MKRRTLVIDASAAVHLVSADGELTQLMAYRLIAPELLWSEALAAFRAAAWRGELSETDAAIARQRLNSLPIESRSDAELREFAWLVATSLGWAKTYDAEYIALARLLGVPLLTVDARLRRGAASVVTIVGPTEL